MPKYIEFFKDLAVNMVSKTCLIVNIKEQTVFEINKTNYEVFSMLYKGGSFEECCVAEDTLLIQQIVKNNLGKIVEEKPFNEPYAQGSAYYDVEGLIPINAVYIEVPFGCSKNCEFCESVAAFSCERCHKPSSNMFGYNINMLKAIKCNIITLVAGSIANHITEFKNLFLKLKSMIENVEYELICYGDIFESMELKNFCEQYNIKIIASIDINEVNENISISLKQWNTELIQMNYIMDLKEYVSTFNDIKLKNIPYTYTITNIVSKLDFTEFNYTLDPFYMNAIRKYNLCLFSKIYIRSDGTVIPCSGIYDIELGKIRTENINFNQNAIRRMWEGSCVNTKGCKDCAYNIICKECRALDYLLDNKIEEKISCSHLGGN